MKKKLKSIHSPEVVQVKDESVGATGFGNFSITSDLVNDSVLPFSQVPETPTNIPKWYKPFERAKLKKELVKQYLDEYTTPVKLADDSMFSPSVDDVRKYSSLLKVLSLDKLLDLNKFKQSKLNLDILDKIKSIDKKKHAVITIFNDNKSTDTGVCHINSRHFKRAGCTYMVIQHLGVYDPEFKMMHFYYFFNNPWPITFNKNKLPEGNPDGKVLSETIKFEILTALANIDISKTVTVCLVMIILNAMMTLIILFITLKGFKMIG